MGPWIALFLHSKEILGFQSNIWPGPFSVEFACSPRVRVGSHWVLCLPPTISRHAVRGVRLTVDSKLSVEINMSADGCLSLCVIPASVHPASCLMAAVLNVLLS